MSDVINPNAVPIPPVKPDEVEAAGADIKSVGARIARIGDDIHSDWQGLAGPYVAPEASLLLSKTKPVSDKGDDFKSAASTAGAALVAFADEVRPIVARLKSLKADATAFRRDISDGGCEPKDDWREDEDDVERHNKLNNDIMAAVNEYQAAERACANKITGLFGGTRWVAGKLDGSTKGHVYGFEEAPKDVETPWAKPQEYDAPWYEDVGNGIKDFGVGIAQDLASLAGLYGEEGWGWQGLDGLVDNWEATAGGLAGLAGLYGPDGWGWQGLDNLGNNWKELAHAFVPWREWGDRPGYVITQSVLNIGSIFVGGAGLAKGLTRAGIKIGRRGHVDVPDADAPRTHTPDIDAGDIRVPEARAFDDLPTTRDLQDQLDGLDLDDNHALDGLDDALDDADTLDSDLPERQPAHTGGQQTDGSDTTGPHTEGTGHGTSDTTGGADHGDPDPTPDRGDTDAPDQDSTGPDGDTTPSDKDPDSDGDSDTPDNNGDNRDTTPPGGHPDHDGSNPDADQDGGDPDLDHGDRDPDGDAAPDADGTPGPDGDSTPDADSDTTPGHVDPDGIRRFDSDADGERYGDTVLGDTYHNLPPRLRDAVWWYTRQSLPNQFLRNPSMLPGFLRDAWNHHGPGWTLFEMNGGRVPSLDDIFDAQHRTDLTPDQQRMVDDIVNDPAPKERLNDFILRAGWRGWLSQWFNGFPSEADFWNRMNEIDHALDNPLPEAVQVQRGLHDVSFLDGFDPTNPKALEGKIQTEQGYMSTSLGKNPTVVDGKPFKYQMHLDVLQGYPGLYMGKNSAFNDQRELILPRSTRYRITKVTPDGRGGFDINAEVLTPTP